MADQNIEELWAQNLAVALVHFKLPVDYRPNAGERDTPAWRKYNAAVKAAKKMTQREVSPAEWSRWYRARRPHGAI